MNKVYLVCRNVDLGYHVEYVYISEHKANEKASELNKEYSTSKIQQLINGCNYSNEKAEEWVNRRSAEYFVDSIEVEKE